ncbi:hypothetical protein Pelo_5666 [Pelomyxa schiedti]|nr:hypothetical protein Pelo_5666 [Pelomyxa schiedti]
MTRNVDPHKRRGGHTNTVEVDLQRQQQSRDGSAASSATSRAVTTRSVSWTSRRRTDESADLSSVITDEAAKGTEETPSEVSALEPLFCAEVVESIYQANSDVFIVKEKGLNDLKVAIKRQVTCSANNADTAHRELSILLQLGTLTKANKCGNFVELSRWFKVTTPLYYQDIRNPPALNGTEFLVIVLKFADTSLRSLVQERRLSLYEFKCYFFQILYALAIARRDLEFNHNDLHSGNILLQAVSGKTHLAYHDAGTVWFTNNTLVTLIDFGLSRIQLPSGEVVGNPKGLFHGSFSPTLDNESLLNVMKACAPRWDSSKVQTPPEGKENIPTSETINPSAVANEDPIKHQQHLLFHLKKLIRDGTNLFKVLRHEFFRELTQDTPTDTSSVVWFSSDGDITSLQRQFANKGPLPVEHKRRRVLGPLSSNQTTSSAATTHVVL